MTINHLPECDAVVARAKAQCPILQTGDAGWLNHDYIKHALAVTASLYGNRTRTYGKLLWLTHPLRTAHRAYNFGPKHGFLRGSFGAAIVGLCHDAIEDREEDRSPQIDEVTVIQLLGCIPESSFKDGIARDIRALTDTQGMEKADRFAEQMARVKGRDGALSYSPRGMVVRYLEKLDTLEGDIAFARQINLTLRERAHFARMARSNYELIEQMSGPIGDAEKSEFLGLIRGLEKLPVYPDPSAGLVL